MHFLKTAVSICITLQVSRLIATYKVTFIYVVNVKTNLQQLRPHAIRLDGDDNDTPAC